jgi:hypothetical protein
MHHRKACLTTGDPPVRLIGSTGPKGPIISTFSKPTKKKKRTNHNKPNKQKENQIKS